MRICPHDGRVCLRLIQPKLSSKHATRLLAFSLCLWIAGAVGVAIIRAQGIPSLPASNAFSPGDVVNAVQDQRLGTLERQEASTSARVDSLAISVDGLTASLNRFLGFGSGLAVMFGILNALKLIVQIRQKKEVL